MLRLIMDNIPQGVFWKDRQSRYLGCNQVVARAFGLASPEAMIGLDDYHLPGLTREQANQFIADDRAVMERNQPEYGIIEQATLADGSIIWMETNKIPMHDAAGAVVGVLGTWQDITARKGIEADRARLATIVDSSTDAIVSKSLDGTIMSWNAGAEHLFGYTPQEAVGQSITLIVPPERLEEEGDLLARLARGERLDHFETVRRTKDGRLIDISLTLSPIRTPNGQIVGASKIARDITAQKRAEVERDRLFHSSMDLFCVAGRDGFFKQLNPAWETVLGWTVEELKARPWVEFIHPDDRAASLQEKATNEENHPVLDFENRYQHRDGTYRWLQWKAPVPEGDLVFAVARDITARKRAERSAAFRADIGLALTRAGAMRSVLQQCAESMVRAFDAAFARIWTCNVAGTMLELQGSAGLYTHIDGGHARIPVGQYKIGLIAQEKKPHLTNAVIGDPRVHNQEWVQREGMVAFAGYPLLVEGRSVGVMAIFARQPLEEEVLGHLNLAADLIAQFIERTRATASLRESEERFRLASEAFQGLLYDLDLVTGSAFRTAGVNGLLGYSLDEIAVDKDAWVRLLHPDDRDRVLTEVSTALVEGDRIDIEYRLRHRAGHYVGVWDRGQIVRAPDRTPIRIVGSTIDQSARQRAEAELRESEARFRQLIEHAPEAVVILDTTIGRFTQANPAAERLFKLPAEKLCKFGPMEMSPPHQPDGRPSGESGPEFIGRALAGETPVFEWTHRDSEGHDIPCEVRLLRIEIDGRYVVRGSISDITERKRAEAALRESEERLRAVVAATPSCIKLVDADGTLLEMNACGLGLVEAAEAAEVIGQCVYPIIAPEHRAAFTEFNGRICAGQADSLEFEIVGLRGTRRWMQSHAVPLRDPASGKTLHLAITQDVTERKRAEEALRESEAFLRMSQTVGKVGSWQWDLRTNRVRWSDVMYTIYGVPVGEFDGTLADAVRLTHPDDLPAVQAVIQCIIETGEPAPIEYRLVKPDGQIAHLWGFGEVIRYAAGRPVLCVGTVIDVTERKQAEEERLKLEAQIRHAQKLESLGVLAGGIAHDFNNLLTGILGYSDLALMELPPHSPARPLIAEAVSGAHKAADLTKQMLAYSGKGRFVVESLNLNGVVEDMTHLLQVSISKKCVLKLDLMPDLASIEADAVQMRQVAMNLIINASDAIGERSGTIAVTTGVMHCDRDYLSEAYLDENLPEGLYVYLEVTDDGCGMSEETRARIFDPFFTTKMTGRGLGLAAVLGIVRGHRGALKVYSEVGKGTTFKVAFPAVDLPAQLRPTSGSPDAAWRGSGTILVVDDEEAVRGLVRHMLEMMGFTVLTAEDGREGLEVFRRERERIRLVLLDMTMPHLDGAETFREMRRMHGDVKAILTSGYNEQSAISPFAGKGLAGFIAKPYRYEDLLAVVRSALGS
jgi:PAS domain S-box-containing protein